MKVSLDTWEMKNESDPVFRDVQTLSKAVVIGRLRELNKATGIFLETWHPIVSRKPANVEPQKSRHFQKEI